MAEIGERHDGAPADAQHMLEHAARIARRLNGLRENDIVEGVVGIIGEVGVGVALDDRQPLGDAIADALARQLDAAPVGLAAQFQQVQQRAVAAAYIEDARPGLHHGGDQNEVDAAKRRLAGLRRSSMRRVHRRRARGCRVEKAARGGEQLRLVEQERVVALVAVDLDEAHGSGGGVQRMHEGARIEVGNSQSDVNDTTQKRVLVPRKALARTPP